MSNSPNFDYILFYLAGELGFWFKVMGIALKIVSVTRCAFKLE